MHRCKTQNCKTDDERPEAVIEGVIKFTIGSVILGFVGFFISLGYDAYLGKLEPARSRFVFILYLIFCFFQGLFTWFVNFVVQDSLKNASNGGRPVAFCCGLNAFATVLLICGCLGMLYEAFLFKSVGPTHFSVIHENKADCAIFLFTIGIACVQLSEKESNIIVFSLVNVLIVITLLRVAWSCRLIPYLILPCFNIGEQVRLLFYVVFKVICFLPILIPFNGIFAIVLRALLKYNDNAFSRVRFSIVKVMTMGIGEFDFGDIFTEEPKFNFISNTTLIIFVIFLLIMTLSLANLLIGQATGVFLDSMQDGSENWIFNTKVRWFLENVSMFGNANKIFEKSLKDLHGEVFCVTESANFSFVKTRIQQNYENHKNKFYPDPKELRNDINVLIDLVKKLQEDMEHMKQNVVSEITHPNLSTIATSLTGNMAPLASSPSVAPAPRSVPSLAPLAPTDEESL